MVRVRFAPSPTGFLHVGGARTALFNYLFAKKNGGTFILRIDDTDMERSEPRFEVDILDSLQWMGLDWQEGVMRGGDFGPYRQSEKVSRYREVGEVLRSQGKAVLDEEGVLRLVYPGTKVSLQDLVCGDIEFSTDSLGNPPALLRSDGSPTYHLASTVDDMDMKITHIVRGQDHLTNTAKHLLIMEALGYKPPHFAHLPLIHGEDGQKLSKRNADGMVSVRDFQREGYLPEALVNFLMLLGWSHPEGKELLTLDECVESFDFSRVGSTAAVFDTAKLDFMNGHWIRTADAEKVAKSALEFAGEFRPLIEEKSSGYWLAAISALRSGFATMRDVETLVQLLFLEDVVLNDEAKAYLAEGDNKDKFLQIAEMWAELVTRAEFAQDGDVLTEEEFNQCFAALKRDFKKEKTLLFKTIRICVTGSLSGYELKVLVPFIERNLLSSRARTMIASVRSFL